MLIRQLQYVDKIAGAFYGEAGIPEGCLLKLARHDDICLLADQPSQKGVYK